MALNENLSSVERAVGVVGSINIEYNHPTPIPQHFSGVAKTTQNNTLLQIVNLSAAFELTVFLDPAPPTGDPFVNIPANDRTPRRIVQNYNGSILKIANVSQEAATALVTLSDLG